MGQREDAPDGAVVRRVLAGDVEAFGALVRRYREAFGRYSAALCGDGDMAADAMQEAFIRAFRGLATCRNPDRFGSWFFRILTNQCRNHRKRWKHHESLGPLEWVAAEETADGPLAQVETRRAIDEALSRLRPELREAFVLRHVDGRSYGEMAVLLDEREDLLRMRVHRARERMQRYLEETT